MGDVHEPGEIEVVQFGSSATEHASAPIVLTPEFEAADFAELEERFRNMPDRTDAWRAAGLWALNVLKQVLGEQWPGRTSPGRDGKAWVVADLCGAHSHTRHYARLLELALWLDGLASAPGIARVRKALRGDRTPGRWEHTRIQLEIAALAEAGSASVAFEGARRTERDSWPADVEAVIGERRVTVETFAVLPSDAWLAKVERTDAIQARLRRLEHRHQVACSVDFGGESLDEGDSLERFLTQVEYGATIVAAGAAHHTAREGRAVAHIGRSIPSGFNGPPIQIENAWERVAARLGEKQTQVGQRHDTVWLRVDLLEGMWQFTQWSQAPLRTKLDLIAPPHRGGPCRRRVTCRRRRRLKRQRLGARSFRSGGRCCAWRALRTPTTHRPDPGPRDTRGPAPPRHRTRRCMARRTVRRRAELAPARA